MSRTRIYTAETAAAEIMRLAKQIEGMTKKGEPAKGTFNAKLLATCRAKKTRLEGMLTRDDRPEQFHSAAWAPTTARPAATSKPFPPSFNFRTRADAPDPSEYEDLGIPEYLKRNKDNWSPIMG